MKKQKKFLEEVEKNFQKSIKYGVYEKKIKKQLKKTKRQLIVKKDKQKFSREI